MLVVTYGRCIHPEPIIAVDGTNFENLPPCFPGGRESEFPTRLQCDTATTTMAGNTILPV